MRLPFSFYQRNTETVARELLGKKLVHVYRGKRISGIITEVEAYLGLKDKACHSYGDRRTKRTEVLYGQGGHAYIYFIYGMYDCFNVVTEKKGVPEAVLVRALEPVEGIEFMKTQRRKKALVELTTGPGKLCQALKITRKQSGESLLSDRLFIEETDIKERDIIERTRIGIAYAEDHADLKLRFYLANTKFISKK